MLTKSNKNNKNIKGGPLLFVKRNIIPQPNLTSSYRHFKMMTKKVRNTSTFHLLFNSPQLWSRKNTISFFKSLGQSFLAVDKSPLFSLPYNIFLLQNIVTAKGQIKNETFIKGCILYILWKTKNKFQ